VTSTLPSLMLVVTAAWLLIMAGSLIIFRGIVPIPDLFGGSGGAIATSVVKTILAVALVLLWAWILVKLRDAYVRRKLFPETRSETVRASPEPPL